MIGGLVACAHSLWRGGRAGDALQRERDAVAAPVRQTLAQHVCARRAVKTEVPRGRLVSSRISAAFPAAYQRHRSAPSSRARLRGGSPRSARTDR